MRSHRKPPPSLADVTSYSEAVQVLNVRKAPTVFKKTLDLIFKIDQKQPTGRSYVKQMLQETESDLKKVEEENLLGHQMNETHDEEDELHETEGNPSSGKEHPKPYSIADKTGVVAQSDGNSVEDQTDKVENPTADASKPAQSQPGISQLKEAIDQVADMGSVDPMNKAVIDYMGNGMSQVEAQNAAVMDNNLMEAVFKKQIAKTLPKVLTVFANKIASLQETIRVYDSKIEGVRKEAGQTGMSEAIMINPTIPEKKVTNRFTERSVDQIQKDIAEKYIDMS